MPPLHPKELLQMQLANTSLYGLERRNEVECVKTIGKLKKVMIETHPSISDDICNTQMECRKLGPIE